MGLCAFCYTWNLLGVTVLHGPMLNWGSVYHGYMCILVCLRLIGCNSVAWIYGQFGGSICHGYMCIWLYMKLIGCNGFAWIYAWIGGSISHWYICILLYVWLMGCNGVAQINCHLRVCLPWIYVHSAICEMNWLYWCSINLWSIGGWSFCQGYMCIILYMKLIGCNTFAWIYGQLRGPSAMGMCAFCYVWLIGCNSVAWTYGQFGGSICHSVYLQSAINEMYWVYWCSMNLWSIGGWSFCQRYMCILLYVKLLGFNSVAWIYAQFGGLGPSVMGVCAFCYTWNLLGVTVLHGSMLNLGVHQPWVYVHSAIHENYWV